MEMRSEPYAGMTFASSMRGWRYDRLNQNIVFAVLAAWLFINDSIRFGELEWGGPVIFVLVWALMSWLMRGSDKRRVFGARVNVLEDHLEVVDDGVSSRIPWKDILYVRIDRSPSGHRRNIRIRARGGKLFRLMDPEDGELMESWALELAKAAGIKVKVRKWVTLNAEPVWTFLLFVGLLAATHFVNLRDLF